MSHEFSFVGRIVVDLSDLPHLPLVLTIFARAKNAPQGLDTCKLLSRFVVVFKLSKKNLTIFTLC